MVHLEDNMLNGSIPLSLGINTNLIDVRLSWNNFTGLLPHYLGHNHRMRIFMASHNNIEGGFPDSFNDMYQLRVLNLGHNLIHGQFPLNLQHFRHLKVLAVQNNRIYGSLPNMSQLKNLELSKVPLEVLICQFCYDSFNVYHRVLWLENNLMFGNIKNFSIHKHFLQDIRLRNNYFYCNLYHDWKVVYSDSPKTTSSCLNKMFTNPITRTLQTIFALP